MKNYISINISYIRKQNHLSQRELSHLFGLSSTVVGGYERGISYPSVEFIQKFCRDYEVSIDDFFNKDLSKTEASNYFVNEPNDSYKYDSEIKRLKSTIEHKDKIIEAKDSLLNEKDISIKTLNKTNNILSVLLNQNNTLEKLQIVSIIDEQIKKASE